MPEPAGHCAGNLSKRTGAHGALTVRNFWAAPALTSPGVVACSCGHSASGVAF